MTRIMIIEDNLELKRELISFLKRYGYDAFGPNNFENIVENILNETKDLVLLDINLPYYDGYYICREIRKVSNIPIIVVTSRDSDMDELMSINLGADDFITKPYNTEILLARIASVLRRAKGNEIQDILEYNGLKLNLTNGTINFNENIKSNNYRM